MPRKPEAHPLTMLPLLLLVALFVSGEKFKTNLLSVNHFSPEGSRLLSSRKDLTTRSLQSNSAPVEVLNASAGEDSDYLFSVPLHPKVVYAPVLKLDFPPEFRQVFESLNSSSTDYSTPRLFLRSDTCLVRLLHASLLGLLKDMRPFSRADFHLFKNSFFYDPDRDSVDLRCQVEPSDPNENAPGRNLTSPK